MKVPFASVIACSIAWALSPGDPAAVINATVSILLRSPNRSSCLSIVGVSLKPYTGDPKTRRS